MTNTEMLRGALRAVDVLDRFGVAHRPSGRELRTRVCPACGECSRPAFSVAIDSGLWWCHRCEAHGDVFGLLAGFLGLDVEREFTKVLAVAADITGNAPPTAQLEAYIAADRHQVSLDERRREAARTQMPDYWNSLARRSRAGESYLAGRGIDATELNKQGDIVRYASSGEPCVALRDLVTGNIVGIQRRRIVDGEPKTPTVYGSRISGAALAGRLDELDRGGVDVAVIAEGLADTLVARVAFAGCAVFGAAGAAQLVTVATAVATRVLDVGGVLLLVVDDDDTGTTNAAKAVIGATAAGLRLDVDLVLVELGEHHDLADAWRAGWRWSWPALEVRS